MYAEAGGGQRALWLRTQRQHTVSSSVAMKNVTTQLIPLARHRSAATATGRKYYS